MLVYENEFICGDFPRVVFLCGNKFIGSENFDKRSILKTYIEENAKTFHPIILEENFFFKKTNLEYLSYDEVFLKNLLQVEQLASIFADKIIIIHETISTAAELGMFARDVSMMKKICLLVPDNISIEEKKITSFIQLAYINSKTPKEQIGSNITFYPDIEIVKYSEFKSDYRTSFHNNEIGKNLGEKVLNFLLNNSACKAKIKFCENRFDKPCADSNIITYSVNQKDKNIAVYVSEFVLRIQLLSLFYIDELKKEIRKEKPIIEHVNYISKIYKETILNTICSIKGFNVAEYKATVKFNSILCDLNKAIGYFIYMLQGAKLINLESSSANANASIRKIRITNNLKNYKCFLGGYIKDTKTTNFGRLGI